jgi:hypothetical protein
LKSFYDETFQSKVIIHNNNFDDFFNENQALLTYAFEFSHAKIYVPTYIRSQYFECEMIRFNQTDEGNNIFESNDLTQNNENSI